MVIKTKSKDVLIRKLEALKVENAKLKQQLMSTKLEKWCLIFRWYSDEERSAVRRCYDYIGYNYDGWLVWEDFVAYYVSMKEDEEGKSIWELNKNDEWRDELPF